MRRLFASVCLLVLLVAPVMAAEDELAQDRASPQAPVGVRENFQITSIVPGFGNRYRQGCFFPVAVEMSAQIEPVAGTITVASESGGADVPVYTVPFELTPGTRYRYFVYPYCSTSGERYQIAITDSRGRTYRREELTMDDRDRQWYYVAILGGQGVTGITKRDPTERSCGLDTAFVAPELMPSKSWGYDCADVLLWPHPDPAEIPAVQQTALREWVLGGGRLVLCVGDSWQAAAAAPLLRELIPGTVTGAENLTDLSDLVAVGGAPFQSAREMLIAVLDKPRGEIVLKAGRLPVVVRNKAGFGEVIFVAFDPTKNPFAQWDGAGKFWNAALGLNLEYTPKETAAAGRTTGYYGAAAYAFRSYGMENSLLTALNQFEEVQPISFAFIVLFLAVYVILVGPVDYFVLKKLKHLEWTWFTFPGIAIAATVVAFVVISASRSANVYINQLTVADWSADGKASRCYTTSAVISPRNKYYDVSYNVANSALWLAGSRDYERGGRVLGAFTSLNYQVRERPESGMAFSEVFMPVWSPKTFSARWSGAAVQNAPLKADLRIADGVLTGAVANVGTLELYNVTVVCRDGVYKLGEIAAGQSRDISTGPKVAYDTFVDDAAGRLAGWDSAGDSSWVYAHRLVSAATFSKDGRFFPVEYYRQVMSSTETGGGFSYYDLPSELSVRSLVESGQAVIIASADSCPAPVVTSASAAKKRDSTVYRVCVAVPRS